MKVEIKRAAPPVSERPKCPNCDEPLQPSMRNETKRRALPASALAAGGFTYDTISKEWEGNYHSYGMFCTLRCGTAFANEAYRRGFRINRPSKLSKALAQKIIG